MPNIPTEIFTLVYTHLCRNDMLQCALVCKDWKETAMASFYKNLDLKVYNTFLTKKLLKLPAVERNNCFQYGLFTKKLNIGNDKEDFIHYSRELDENLVKEDDCRFDKEDWVQLLEYLPNLQELDLSRSCNGEIYLQYIYETDSKKALLKIQKIKPIDQNPFSYRREPLSLLFAVCYKYRASITTLKVAFVDPVFSFGFISGQVITLLNDFKRLTCLTLTNECDESLTTLDLQASCPLLVSLDYYSDYKVPDDTIKEILDNEVSNEKNVKCSLKKMVISGASIPKYYSRYIIDYVSPYLDVFNLNMYEHDLYDWVDYIGYENALNFLRNMNTIEEAGVHWHPDKYYERASTNTGSDATIFFTLLNAFKGDKQIYCKADYSDFRPRHKGMVNTKDDLCVEYGLSYHDYLQINENVQNDSDEDSDEEIDVRLSNRTVQIKLPDTSISSIGPEIIHHLSVTMCNSNPDLPVNFLRYAFSNCPNLQCFFYYSMNDPYYRICVGNSIDSGLHSKEKKNSLTNTVQENITVAKFQNMLPSEEIMELLNTHSPRIETLVCGCKNRYTDPPKVMETDLTQLSHLKVIHIHPELLCCRGFDMSFLEIQWSDGDRDYYSVKARRRDINLEPITMEYVEKNMNKEDVKAQSAIIRCDKRVEILIHTDYVKVGGIINGEFIAEEKDTFDFHNIFLS